MIFGSMCAKWMSSLDSGLWLNIQCHYEILTTSRAGVSFEQSIIIFEFNLQQSAFQLDIFLPFLPQLLVNKIDSKKGIFCNFLDLNTLRFFDKFSSNLFKLFIQDFWHFLLNISTTFYIKLFSFSFIRQFFPYPNIQSQVQDSGGLPFVQ